MKLGRAQYYKEIDIVDHIMKFREVMALLEEEEKAKAQKQHLSNNKPQNINPFKRFRTRVLPEIDDEEDDDTLFGHKQSPKKSPSSLPRSQSVLISTVKPNKVGIMEFSSPSKSHDLSSSNSIKELDKDSQIKDNVEVGPYSPSLIKLSPHL